MNDTTTLLLLALLPSIVVFLTAFYTLRQFMGREMVGRAADFKREDRKQVLPLRLQAYERLVLFLERISPGALVLRVHKSNMTSRTFHAELTATIREEFEHNVTQQIYVSDRAWQLVKQAKEETIRIINIAYERAGDNAPGTTLSQHVFETAGRLTHLPTDAALLGIREEVRRLF